MSQPSVRLGIPSCLLLAALAIGQSNSAEPPKVLSQPATIKAPDVSGQYQYVAETVDPMKQVGSVSAAGITWLCKDRRCTVSGPWPVPGIAACQALAAEVGPLHSYGHSSRTLTPAELEQCNRGQKFLAQKPSTPTMPASKVATDPRNTVSASPQPEPPTKPFPGVAPGKASAPAPAASGAVSAVGQSIGVASIPPGPGGAGIGQAPGPGARPGEPGTPTPAPGSRGPGSDPDAIRDIVQRLRDEMAHCRPEDQPIVRLVASLRPEETLITDRVTLAWSVSRSDGGSWASRVFLGRADDPVVAYSEVENSGESSFDGTDLSPYRTVQWVIYTRCGEARALVGRLPSPRISAIPGILDCDRRVILGRPHPCPPLSIQGSGFGSGSMPLRRVQLVAGDRVVDDLEIQSWTDREITLRTPPDFPRGTYTVVVRRGFSEDRFETARTSAAVIVRWRDVLDKTVLELQLQSIFFSSEMMIDNLGERHCELAWMPRERAPTPDEVRTRAEYCRATPDPDTCVQVTSCSVYKADGSYLDLAIAGDTQHIAFAIPMKSINTGVLGSGRYFVDDMATIRRGLYIFFESGPEAQLNVRATFESDGLELRGFGDSAGGGDDSWPDGEMNDAILEMATHLVVSDGTLTVLVDPAGVRFSAHIGLGGICGYAVDICDLFGGYKEAIRAGVAATVPAQFNAPDNQRALREALRRELCRLDIGGISVLESNLDELILYPTDEVGCRTP